MLKTASAPKVTPRSWRLEDQAACLAALLSFAVLGTALGGALLFGDHRSGGVMTLTQFVEASLVFGSIATLCGVGGIWFAIHRSAVSLRRMTATVDRIGRDPMVTMVPAIEGPRDLETLSLALRALMRRAGFADKDCFFDDAGLDDPHQAFPVFNAKRDSDLLTGLLKRRAFLILADDCIPYFNRYRRSVAILVVDVDHLKAFNQKHGRALGDTMLRNVADVLALSVRLTDKVSRFGGDEFVVLLREIGVSDSRALAERMRRAVEETMVQHESDRLAVTVSIGIAVVSDDDTDVQSLIGRADQALLAAKKRGRNRVEYQAALVEDVRERAA